MPPNTRTDLTLDRFLPYVMSNLAETISSELSTIYMKQNGLSTSQWRVLANLAQHKTLTARELVALTAMEKTKISRAVSGLGQRGLLSQIRAEGDNRSKDLTLTEAGTELYQSIVPKVLSWERDLVNCLNGSEYRDLMYLLGKLKLQLERGRDDTASA